MVTFKTILPGWLITAIRQNICNQLNTVMLQHSTIATRLPTPATLLRRCRYADGGAIEKVINFHVQCTCWHLFFTPPHLEPTTNTMVIASKPPIYIYFLRTFQFIHSLTTGVNCRCHWGGCCSGITTVTPRSSAVSQLYKTALRLTPLHINYCTPTASTRISSNSLVWTSSCLHRSMLFDQCEWTSTPYYPNSAAVCNTTRNRLLTLAARHMVFLLENWTSLVELYWMKCRIVCHWFQFMLTYPIHIAVMTPVQKCQSTR